MTKKQLKMLSNRIDMLRYGLEVSVFNAPNKLFVIGHLKSVSSRLSTFFGYSLILCYLNQTKMMM